jgi:hypothetical protein
MMVCVARWREWMVMLMWFEWSEMVVNGRTSRSIDRCHDRRGDLDLDLDIDHDSTLHTIHLLPPHHKVIPSHLDPATPPLVLPTVPGPSPAQTRSR